MLFGLPADEEATENGEDMRFAPAGSSLDVGTRKGVFGSSVRVVTVRSRLLALLRPLRCFLFCLADIGGRCPRDCVSLVCQVPSWNHDQQGDLRIAGARRRTMLVDAVQKLQLFCTCSCAQSMKKQEMLVVKVERGSGRLTQKKR